tara:strand:+ start:21756 stop:22841 length:1086 start_codon:yes stop_codon:yes gene_type:complete
MKQSMVFRGKKILVTGHTGFKGSWLVCFLKTLGAKIYGISNKIPTNPSHYKISKVRKDIKDFRIDIRNRKKIIGKINLIKPDFVFHLAAQSLVKTSISKPVETWETNLIGTLNLLEALRRLKKKCNVIIITSDKCYKNTEKKTGYLENDPMGGDESYSASKGSAELLINSYIKSYFSSKKNKIFICTARAGNVVGGGDWSKDRLIPDCIRSWSKKKPAIIRNPHSVRPWQHVLDVINGYIILAKKLNYNSKFHGKNYNFGPKKNFSKARVIDILRIIKTEWPDISWKIKDDKKLKETKLLKLATSKARKELKWRQELSLHQTIKLVVSWYRDYLINKKIKKEQITFDQIKSYKKKLLRLNK